MSSSGTERSLLLFGTAEPPAPLRALKAGLLTAQLDGGNLRYISWRGIEVLRALSFIVRDSHWGTYAPVFRRLEVTETPERFAIDYEAVCTGSEGDFSWSGHISGSAHGQLTYLAEGRSAGGFTTNRAGFVVLHPAPACCDCTARIVHGGGTESTMTFPALVAPDSPATDMASLRYAASGVDIAIRFAGDTFEMEDQRNWTDSSFKTYVRALARGYPYALTAGEELIQSVVVDLAEAAPSRSHQAAPSEPALTIGQRAGRLPQIGIALDGSIEVDTAAISATRPNYIVARIETSGPIDRAKLAALTSTGARDVDLDVIVSGKQTAAELAALAAALPLQLSINRLMIMPERDRHTRRYRYVPPGEDDLPSILEAARRVFPSATIGGGTTAGFAEFNRNRPAADVDFFTHSTQAIVHAADDRSVMETLSALPFVIRSAKAILPGAAYRLGPGTIAAPRSFYAVPPAANPELRRLPTGESDPRDYARFGAAFAFAYVAVAAVEGVEAVTLATSSSLLMKGTASPLIAAIAQLSQLAGRSVLAVSGVPQTCAAFATEDPEGTCTLWIANLTDALVELDVAGKTERRALRVDAYDVQRVSLGPI